ncbi:MAG: hypothetical protein KGD63_11505 [Candidatus Lokiarchaeota archaeon]|nr:hypothetical protein [Candidatus Lokiarchaeota archaeon]
MISISQNTELDQNSYFTAPFHKITDLVLERYTTDNIFQEMLNFLFLYFKTIKRHRTINDVDKVFEYLDEFLESYHLEDIGRKEIEAESEKLKEDIDCFIKNNFERIEQTLNDAKSSILANIWISNIRTTFTVFAESLKAFKRKIRRLSRRSKRARDTIEDRLSDLHKAIFLVLFRIVEQIYMIANNDPFIPENEIEFLIEDIVYLENIARTISDTFN